MRFLDRSLLFLLFASAIFAQTAYIRVSHGIADLASVSVSLGQNQVISNNLAFGDTSPYFTSTPGFHTVFFQNATDNVTLVEVNVTIGAFSYHTLVATGLLNYDNKTELKAMFTLTLDSNGAPTNPTTASVTLFHGIADLGGVDVKVNGNLVFANVTYTKLVSGFLPSGVANLNILPAGKPDVLVNLTETFQPGFVYTLYAQGVTTVQFRISTVQDASYTYFHLRVSHDVLGANPVNVALYDPFVNSSQNVVSTPVSFGKFSPYSSLLSISGGQRVVVTDSTTNKVVFDQPIVFTPNTMSTLVLLFNGTDIESLVLQDDNSAPNAQNNARVRFIHGVAGAPPVGLRINGQIIFSGVSFSTSTDYANAITLRDNSLVEVLAGNQPILTLSVALVSGGVYTIAAYGILGKEGTTLVVNNDAQYDFITLRIANAVPNVPVVSVSFIHGGQSPSFPVNYGTISTYSTYVIANYSVVFSASGKDILTVTPSWTKNTAYTAVLLGVNGDNATHVRLQLLEDKLTPPQSSNLISVRAVNAAPGIGSVSFSANGQSIFPNVAFGESSAYDDTLNGNMNYNIVATVGVNETVASITQNPTSGGIYTVILLGGKSNNATFPVLLVAFQDILYQYAFVRVVHAVPDAGTVQVVLDDGENTPLTPFPDISFKSITSYFDIPLTGYKYTVKILSGETVVISEQVTLVGGTFYTASAVGFADGRNNNTTPLTIAVATDSLDAPASSSSSRIRIVHLAPGAPNVNVYLNSQAITQWENIPYQTASSYSPQNVVGSNNRFDVYVASSGKNVLTVSNVVFKGGEVTSIFVFGSATDATLAPVLQNDAVFTYSTLRISHAAPNLGPIKAIITGTATESISFGTISAWEQVVNAGTLGVQIVDASNGTQILQKNVQFPPNQQTTLILSGLGNEMFKYDLLAVANPPALPTSNTVSKIRVGHLSPGSPNVDLRFTNSTGPSFSDVAYLSISNYVEYPQGVYNLEVFAVGGNKSIAGVQVNLTGGYSYSVFVEGILSKLNFVTTVDYTPPNAFHLRVLHTSPNAPLVDALVDGSSYGFNGLGFATASQYVPINEGQHNLTIQPSNQIPPSTVYLSESIKLDAYKSYSVFFVGLINGTNSSAISSVVLTDDLTLPPKTGDIRLRFVHASPDAPAVTIRSRGIDLFAGIDYKNSSNYQEISNNIYVFELLVASTRASVLQATVDLRVKTEGRAVYTLVAEGLVNPKEGQPGLALHAYLDNGDGLPDNRSSSQQGGGGLGGVAIGLIIAGVAVFVIVVAAAGFIFWKKRNERAGYSTIESRDAQ